jgi:hypothetical protein
MFGFCYFVIYKHPFHDAMSMKISRHLFPQSIAPPIYAIVLKSALTTDGSSSSSSCKSITEHSTTHLCHYPQKCTDLLLVVLPVLPAAKASQSIAPPIYAIILKSAPTYYWWFFQFFQLQKHHYVSPMQHWQQRYNI